MINLTKYFNKNNFFVIVVTFFIFFWDMFHTLNIKFDPRLSIFLLSFYVLSKIVNDIKNKNLKFIYIVLSIFFILIIQSFLVDNLINLKFLFSVILLLYLFSVAYYFHDLILENKNKIVFLFISIFLISMIVHLFFNITNNPEPFSCGAVKNFVDGKNAYGGPDFFIHFISSYSLIFNENSHLAMSGVAVIIYSIFLITQKTQNKFKSSILILFIIICFLKSSATLMVGTLFSLLTIIFFDYKRLNKKFFYSSLILASIVAVIFFTDKVCLNKLVLDDHNLKELEKINPYSDTKKIEKKISNIEVELTSVVDEIKIVENKLENLSNILVNENLSAKDKQKIEIDKNNLAKIKKNLIVDKKELVTVKEDYNKDLKTIEKTIDARPKDIGSMSSDVFFHALKVTYNQFFIKPFGWGFQGYELAFHDYNKKNNVHKNHLNVYNSKDASNTLFKIIVEFGVFSILFYLFLLMIFLNNQISIENKIFLVPFMVTQTIRGAGYFNGAFLFILFLLIILHFKKSKTQN